ncbi:hypothetical protein CDAR_491541 [Caerostris darwini]|uniref:Uncharacterized protein n=1 Tax=Caerostris darwini TaxID=1538125 RepID=A0AAV4XAK3_9ARAC|nr:hypothetical protein CDAR_491541 [Caerostris darwini]
MQIQNVPPFEAMLERLAKQSFATKDLNLLKTGGAVAEKMSKLDTLMDGCCDFKRILSPSSGDNNSIVVGNGMGCIVMEALAFERLRVVL